MKYFNLKSSTNVKFNEEYLNIEAYNICVYYNTNYLDGADAYTHSSEDTPSSYSVPGDNLLYNYKLFLLCFNC